MDTEEKRIPENLSKLHGLMKNINGHKESVVTIWCDNLTDKCSFAVVGDPGRISDALVGLFTKRMNGETTIGENFLYSSIVTAIASCDRMVMEDIKKVCLEIDQIKKANLN